MKDVLKIMFIPIIGCIGIALIFLLVVWSGNFQDRVENKAGMSYSASRDIGGYAVFEPTPDCDDSYFPVCGYDGVTYDNACKAVNAGTTVAYRGACQS